jgi:hypothetical protein
MENGQFEPQTVQELQEYEAMVRGQISEHKQNQKNGKFLFWFIVSLFGASAIAAALAQ